VHSCDDPDCRCGRWSAGLVRNAGCAVAAEVGRAGVVEVLRVYHAARRWPERLPW